MEDKREKSASLLKTQLRLTKTQNSHNPPSFTQIGYRFSIRWCLQIGKRERQSGSLRRGGCARARVYATTNSSRRSLSLSFDDDDAKKGVQLITHQREERGFRDHLFSTFLRVLFPHNKQKEEQICCFLTHHPGLLEEDAR